MRQRSFYVFVKRCLPSVPTSFLCHVGVMPLSRHRFCAMSGKRLCPDVVFAPCRENASVPTSSTRHVGVMPLSRPRLRAMSRECLCPAVDFSPNRDDISLPPPIPSQIARPPRYRCLSLL